MAVAVMVSRSATVTVTARAVVATSSVVAEIVALTSEASKLRRRATVAVHVRLVELTPVFVA
jgi:hypothetical protein